MKKCPIYLTNTCEKHNQQSVINTREKKYNETQLDGNLNTVICKNQAACDIWGVSDFIFN